MQVVKDTVVTLTYEMFDASGELIERSDRPMSYLHGGYDGIFPTVEEALQGKSVGETCDVLMEPDDAFGEYDAELVRVEAADMFPKDVKVDMMFESGDEDEEDYLVFRVTEVADGKVVLDGNHPLAGRTLRFVATVAEVRPATKDEVTHGHAHGEHGHHH